WCRNREWVDRTTNYLGYIATAKLIHGGEGLVSDRRRCVTLRGQKEQLGAVERRC
ncbi:hypothetical protein A2U01_0011194, partial [Trifolium medium]|nr:hypothetical protein [Trifolium medium]